MCNLKHVKKQNRLSNKVLPNYNFNTCESDPRSHATKVHGSELLKVMGLNHTEASYFFWAFFITALVAS